ncbi:MAG: 8-oxo-dGTP diphosphatase [Ruminococcaceae bacterium]|nr:8-oxo-dGTP diphosphatase [Oscillospiraceae bacterium]
MKQTTLCYIEKDGAYLMLHRIKKVNDENHDKWVGIGGKLEAGESPFDCVRRETLEEVGLTLDSLRYCGIITFVSDLYGTEYMHLFHSDSFSGELPADCAEGVPSWVKKEDIPALPIWEGDKIFLRLLDTEKRFFSLKLVYRGDNLIEHVLEF